MDTVKAKDACSYQLLIKNLLFTPLVYNPDQEIVYKGSTRITYAAFRERVRRLASMLQKLGVKPGSTVAVMDWDSHRYLECYFAIPMIGAVLHTINLRLSPEQLLFTMDHAEDEVVFLNQDFLPLIEAIKGRLDKVKKYVLIQDEKKDVPSTIQFAGEYEDLLSNSEPLAEFPDFDENTRATTFYTTGTTGLPKGVFFSHRQLVLHTMASIALLSSNHAQGSFHREDVYMPLTPMFHVHAWGVPYMAVTMGVKQVYPGRYIPDFLIRLVHDEKVTFTHCVPTILHMILQDPSGKDVDFSNWKVVIGGAALPRSLATAAYKRGIDIFAGYGMSETCPFVSISQLSADEHKLPADEQIPLRVRTGKPVGLMDVRVVDEAGKDVPMDDKSTGEILLRSPWLVQGYLKDENNSDKLWEGGWLHTNDVAAVNKDRSLRITDRKKDIIKIGGEWISSLEIEDILLQHPAVSEAAIVGKPDDRWGEIPYALVVLKKEMTTAERDLVKHVRGYIDNGVLPKQSTLLKVQFVDAIDKTSVGKVNKIALRKKYLATE